MTLCVVLNVPNKTRSSRLIYIAPQRVVQEREMLLSPRASRIRVPSEVRTWTNKNHLLNDPRMTKEQISPSATGEELASRSLAPGPKLQVTG